MLSSYICALPTLVHSSYSLYTSLSLDPSFLSLSRPLLPLSTSPSSLYLSFLYREWISPATLLYIANTLLATYGTSVDATSLLDNFNVVICPVSNVDGYEYTWTTNRMWRKTRKPNTGSVFFLQTYTTDLYISLFLY
jgi:hypothetical protein